MGARKKSDNDSEGGELNLTDGDDSLGEMEGKGEDSIVEVDPAFKSSLHKWFSTNNRENLQPSVYVYRMTGFRNQQRSSCDFYSDHIPDEHEIGMKHGSGNFEIYVQIPRGKNQPPKASCRRFTVDPYYDTLRKNAAIESLPSTGTHAAAAMASSSNNMAEMFTMFQGMLQMLIQMISPLLNSGSSRPSAGAEMVQSYTAVNALMKQMSLDNMALLNDMQRKTLSLPIPEEESEGEPAHEEGGSGFMDTLIKLFSSPAVMVLLNTLTGAGQKARIAAQTVQAIPDVKKILVDPVRLKETVLFLDKSLGVDKTSQVLRNLSVKRPEGTGRNNGNPSTNTRYPNQRNVRGSETRNKAGASQSGAASVDKPMNTGASK